MDLIVKILTGYYCRTCNINFSGDNYSIDAMKHIISNPSHVLEPHYTYVPSIELFLLVVFLLAGLSVAIYYIRNNNNVPSVSKKDNDSIAVRISTDRNYANMLYSHDPESESMKREMVIGYLYGQDEEISVTNALELMEYMSDTTDFGKYYYDAAMFYLEGKHVKQSYDKAISCLRNAARFGNKDANKKIKEIRYMKKNRPAE